MGQVAVHETPGDRLGDQRSLRERKPQLGCEGLSDCCVIDMSPADENLAETSSGTLLFVQGCAEVPFLEPSGFHQ